jgi:hypothetical protein
VNTVIVDVRIMGRYGKLYQPRRPLPKAERNRLRWLAHRLRCEDGLSIRQVQATMRDSHGVRRSVGQIHNDLVRFECPSCAGQPAAGAGE